MDKERCLLMKKSHCRYRISFVGFVSVLLVMTSAGAATLTVNSTVDDGTGTCTASKCTLRDAILSAVAGDTITFSLSANGTITLTNGELLIDKYLVINGPGANLLTVQRSAAPGTPNFRIFNIPASPTIFGLTIANGNTLSEGGGIYNTGGCFLNRVAVSGNSARNGGGIYSTGTLTLYGTTISGNSASINSASSGGGIYSTGTLTLNNGTVSGNSASNGGGIYDGGTLTLNSATISGNSASIGSGGLRSGAARSRNTIIALNTATQGPDVAGQLTSLGFNLIGNNKDATITPTTGDQIGTAASPINPRLGPLQDNGGPTKTQALLVDSTAIDKGNSLEPTSDQRGFTRPIDSPIIINAGDGSDIGAYEVQPDELAGCSEVNLVVNNNNDDGSGSLRSVIANACGGSTITFAPDARGAITLASGELLVNKNLTINGPGANLLSVQRSATSGTPNFRILNIAANSYATIFGLTIANGNLPGQRGGGIINRGTLNLKKATISGNTANFGGNGGGIYNDFGRLTISYCTLSGNTVSSSNGAGSGGAIFNQGGEINLFASTISGNSATDAAHEDSGGGIISNVGSIDIVDTTITDNSADFGGGIRSINGAVVRLGNTIVALNTSPSGPDGNGDFSSIGFTLIGNNAAMTLAQTVGYFDQVGTPASPIDPLLGPLQDNGGPTFTRGLLPGSPAIDKGNNFSGTAIDQRGFVRPSDDPNIPNPNDGSDIGAFEVQTTTLANISTRLRVETGDNVLIGGFIITGTAPKKIIVRAIGPSLSSLFPGALADPVLELRNSSGGLIFSNDNWRSDQPAEIIATGIPPSHDLESAIVVALPANNSAYTATVRGVSNGTGIGVVEAYDLDRTVDSKLANISTRGLVQTGDNVLIGGLIVQGQGPLRVIVRAIGPSLNIVGKLANPILELRDGNGALIVSNDNWRTDQEAEIIATTIPPTNDLESAIVGNITPGNYTAIVRGVNGSTGVALVEIYALN